MFYIIKSIRDYICLFMSTIFILLVFFYMGELFQTTNIYSIKNISYIVLLALVDFYARKYINNIFLYLAAHVATIPFLVFFSGYTIIYLTAITIFVFLLAFTAWESTKNDKTTFAINPPLELCVFYILIYFHAAYNLSKTLQIFTLYSGILYLSLYLVNLYINRFITTILGKETLTDSTKKSFIVNLSFILLFIVGIVMILSVLLCFISNKTFGFIGTFLSFIFSLVFKALSTMKGSHTDPDTSRETMESMSDYTEDIIKSNSSNSNNFVDMLFNIIKYALYIGLILLITYVIYQFCKEFLHRKNRTSDIIEDIPQDKIIKTKKDKSEKHFQFFLSNREKIRKLYKKRIQSGTKLSQKIHIKKYHTTKDIQNSFSKENVYDSDNLKSLTSTYEKARYSNHEITSNDVNIAKSLKL